MTIASVHLSAWFAVALCLGVMATGTGAEPGKPVDATTLRHKVLCGYQGWFRCPEDAAGEGWRHWSRRGRSIGPESVTVEMWPDMTEYSAGERYPAPGFTNPDGTPATLFSSAHPRTVERHFRWMEEHGIDGVLLQRFLVDVKRPADTKSPSVDRVLSHVRASAETTGRVYALGYDMTGMPADRIYETITNDWKRLVDDEKVIQDDRYLRHHGRPLLFIFGFYSDRFGADLAHRLIDFFKEDSPYRVTLVGGCQWQWRAERDAEWARAFRRFDVVSPWNVANYSVENGTRYATTAYWKDDLAECRARGIEYFPVIYPGFGWTNLKGEAAARDSIPRLGGAFYWRQFVEAKAAGAEQAYVAMFDEGDEGTAIFKVTNAPPTPGRFATYEGRPSDWYLRLTGEGARVIRGERPATRTLPIQP